MSAIVNVNFGIKVDSPDFVGLGIGDFAYAPKGFGICGKADSAVAVGACGISPTGAIHTTPATGDFQGEVKSALDTGDICVVQIAGLMSDGTYKAPTVAA